MKARLRQHLINLQTATAGINNIPVGRGQAIVRTHLQEARNLMAVTLRKLDALGVEDLPYNNGFIRDLKTVANVEALRVFMVAELDELRNTALSTFIYGGKDKDEVLYIQQIYTTARIHVEQAAEWLNDLK